TDRARLRLRASDKKKDSTTEPSLSPWSFVLGPSQSLAKDAKDEGLRTKIYQDSGIRARHTSVLRFSDDQLEERRAVERRLCPVCGFSRGSQRRTGRSHIRQRHPADPGAVVSVLPPARSDGTLLAVDVRRCASVAAIDSNQS